MLQTQLFTRFYGLFEWVNNIQYTFPAVVFCPTYGAFHRNVQMKHDGPQYFNRVIEF